MTTAPPPSLTDVHDRIIRRLARKMATRPNRPATLSEGDYFQTGCLAAWKATTERGATLDNPHVHVIARNAMVELSGSVDADDRRRDAVDADPCRRRSLPPCDAPEALDAAESLNALDPVERRIVVGRYWEDRKDREIAVELGLTVNQVHTRAAKAIRKLRALLEPDYRDEYSRKHPRKYGWRIYDAKRPLKAQGTP